MNENNLWGLTVIGFLENNFLAFHGNEELVEEFRKVVRQILLESDQEKVKKFELELSVLNILSHSWALSTRIHDLNFMQRIECTKCGLESQVLNSVVKDLTFRQLVLVYNRREIMTCREEKVKGVLFE